MKPHLEISKQLQDLCGPTGSVTASPCDWICKYDDGSWDVMTNDQYKASVKLKKLEK